MTARWLGILLLFTAIGCSSDPSPQPALERHLAAYDGTRAETLHHLYDTQNNALIWARPDRPTKTARTLLNQLCNAGREGLSPGTYFLDSIEVALRQAYVDPPDADALRAQRVAKLDLLLTQAFATYASHLLTGRVRPEAVNGKWHLNDDTPNLAEVLSSALDEGVDASLDELAANHRNYAPLRQALIRYRAVAAEGGWPRIPPGDPLSRGSQGARVFLLRQRLATTNDLAANAPGDSATYTAAVETAVRRFQRRHNLDADGTVDTDDLTALNVSAETRAEQLALNLERHRWLPERLGETMAFVNLTNFQLSLHRGDETTFEMPVVVGEQGWQTPVFADTMSHAVFGPYWNVPTSIAKKQLLPKIKENDSYLADNNYEVVNASNETVDASRLTPEALNAYTLRIRQKPGPGNALGRVKFMFPNRFNIYLHDTPTEYLFERNRRAFSHGCIRVGEPAAFAEQVLNEDRWPRDRIRTAMNKATQRRVDIEDPLPVYIVYLTAWATDDGTPHFRRDLYDHDPALRNALDVPDPAQTTCTTIREHLDAASEPSWTQYATLF